MLCLKEITNQKQWSGFIEQNQPHTFLHSWHWGEVQQQLGLKIWRFGIYQNDILQGIALIIKIVAKRGTFLFCPHGPIIHYNNQKHLAVFTRHLKKLCKLENASFFRISPTIETNTKTQGILQTAGFHASPIHMHSELTWILDITPHEDDLLRNMRKGHKSAIKKSLKEDLTITISKNPKDIDIFYKVYEKTVDRQKFIPYTKKYFLNEFEHFLQSDEVRWFFAVYNNEVISVAMILFSKNSAFYHHGASIFTYPNIPAGQLLQWEIIKEAKKRGCSFYNFWGIAPEDKPKHPWRGFTRFKTGFGGQAYNFLRSQDYVVNWKYWVNWIIESVRRIRRGY